MTKLATLRLIDGDLEQGIRAVLTIATSHSSEETTSHEVSGALPPNIGLANTIKQWRSNYRGLAGTRIQGNQIIYDASIHQCRQNCQKLDKELRSQLNTWLLSDSFRSIRDKWLEQLMQDEVRVIIRTSSHSLLKLPWQLWDLIERNPLAEIALGTPDAEPPPNSNTPTLRGRVRVLAILGDSEGIDIESDRELLDSITDAEVKFLPEPKLKDINDQLWEQDWDILFFAGHSGTEDEEGRIKINATESLTIPELRFALGNAVDRGLKLAIFNSCDGMELAFELQQLNLPQVIVMREPVPDEIAQEFLRYFLPAYVSGKSLYLAEREARLRLHGREDQFPGASWLPVIFQSPAATPPTWLDLGRRSTTLCPYRGLFAFREEDALFFHGRENFIQTLVEATLRDKLVSVIGASGSGKSSVVFAGLVPELKRQGAWNIVSFRPGQRPFQSLSTAWVALRASHQSQVDQLHSVLQLAEEWRTDSTALHNTIDAAVRESPETKLLFIVDQFEELYTQCQDTEERQAFIDGLLKVVELTNVALVITLRSDFLGQALTYPPLANVLRQGNRMLGAMSSDELQAAIAEPASLLGVTLEEGLIDRMIAAVSQSNGNLPLLEFALQELWKKREGIQLTHVAYDEIGGLEAAVARYMEQAYNRLSESEKERSRQIFLQLVRPGEGTVDTRRVASHAEIGDDNWDLVTRLASERLVVTGQDAIAKAETVELVHEALIYAWKRLQDWIEENRNFRLWQERLRATIQQWEVSERDEGALLRGKFLIDAEDWLQKRPEELTAEKKFIVSSINLREYKQKKQSQQRKRILFVLTGGLMGALGLAIVAGIGWWRASNAANNDRIKALIAESRSFLVLSNSSIISVRLNEEDTNSKKVSFQQEALQKAILAGRELQKASIVEKDTHFLVLETLRQVLGEKLEPMQFSLSECESRLDNSLVTWSSDGKTIACVNYDGTVRLWDGKTGRKTNVFQGDSEWIDDVQFSPDGERVASGSLDGTVNLWEWKTGKKLQALKGHLSRTSYIGYSQNGQILAAVNSDGTLTLWEVETGKELRELTAQVNSKKLAIQAFRLSPNGQFLASLEESGGKKLSKTLTLWDIKKGRKIKDFESRSSGDNGFSFSPDSKTLVYADSNSATDQGGIRIWSIPEMREIKHLRISGDIKISPNSQIILESDYSKKQVLLWNIVTGLKMATLNMALSWLQGIYFRPDNSLLAIISSNGSENEVDLTLWNQSGVKLKTIKRFGYNSEHNLAFSPDNKKIVINSFGDIKSMQKDTVISNLLDLSTGRQLKLLATEAKYGLTTMSHFSPDGKFILILSDGVAHLFDSMTGEKVNFPNLSNSRDVNIPPIMSKDGKFFTTLRTDGSVRQHNNTTSKEKILRWNAILSKSGRISDDNKRITTVNWYGKLQERELSTGKILRSINIPFRKNSYSLVSSNLEISPDERRVAGAMSNGTIKVWDAISGKELVTIKLEESSSEANEKNVDWIKGALLFSPNSKIIATLGKIYRQDKGAKLELWEASTGKKIRLPEKLINVNEFSFASNSQKLAILKPDNTIQIWNLSIRQLEKQIIPTLPEVKHIQLSDDMLFISDGENLKVLDIKTDRELSSIKLPSGVSSPNHAEFSSDGKTLLLRSGHNNAFVNFDLEDLLRRSCELARDLQNKNQAKTPIEKHICDSVS
jgi:WD40 repeat protein